jgi:hypothetical protein
MFLQEAFYIYLCLFVAFIATAPNLNPNFDDSHLPSLRLSREEVQAMKERQTHPPGYIYKYITIGNKSTPVIEIDPDMLLDDDDGVYARSLAPRWVCYTVIPPFGNCNINYCWADPDDNIYTEAIAVIGSSGPSNPTNVTTSNSHNLVLNGQYNTGYKGWFPTGHECSNSDTQIYTNHTLGNNNWGVAHITGLVCETCQFADVIGDSLMVTAKLAAQTNDYGPWTNVTLGPQG